MVILEIPGQGHAVKMVIEGADGRHLASLTPGVFAIPAPKRPRAWGAVRGMTGQR